MTPLVTVTHYLSHPPSSRSDSVLIAVMSVCCTADPDPIRGLSMHDLSGRRLLLIINQVQDHYSNYKSNENMF